MFSFFHPRNSHLHLKMSVKTIEQISVLLLAKILPLSLSIRRAILIFQDKIASFHSFAVVDNKTVNQITI